MHVNHLDEIERTLPIRIPVGSHLVDHVGRHARESGTGHHGIWIGFFGGLLQDINLGASTAMGFEGIRHYLGMNILPKSVCGYFAGKFSSSLIN